MMFHRQSLAPRLSSRAASARSRSSRALPSGSRVASSTRARIIRRSTHLQVDLLQSLGTDVRERNGTTVVRLLPRQHALATGHAVKVCAKDAIAFVSRLAPSNSRHPRAVSPSARALPPRSKHPISNLSIHRHPSPRVSRLASRLPRRRRRRPHPLLARGRRRRARRSSRSRTLDHHARRRARRRGGRAEFRRNRPPAREHRRRRARRRREHLRRRRVTSSPSSPSAERRPAGDRGEAAGV